MDIACGKGNTVACDEEPGPRDSRDAFMIVPAVTAKTQRVVVSRIACGQPRDVVSDSRITC